MCSRFHPHNRYIVFKLFHAVLNPALDGADGVEPPVYLCIAKSSALNIYTITSNSPFGENIANSEKSMLDDAKAAIENILGELVNIGRFEGKPISIGGVQYQVDLEAVIKVGEKERRLWFEIKSSGEPRMIAQQAGYLKALQGNCPDIYLVLVAPFVSFRGREFCREAGIGFIDLEGNAYLQFDGVLIDRYGKKSETKEKRVLKRLFTTKSTWIIRKMLADPKREWKTNELADEAKVSMGQVYKVTERLKTEGYLEKKWGSLLLKSSGELLDAWRKIYDITDQNMVGYYSPIKDRKVLYNKLKQLNKTEYALTLGAAANLVAPFVRSTDNYIYSKDFDVMKMILELEPVEFGGNLYLVEPSDEGVFFDTQIIEGVSVVSNIQLYLDLYKYPARGKEQADFLRENVMEL